MKINTEHIAQLDAALQKAGIRYVDIRVELTDHMAAAMEQQGGDFNTMLTAYMQRYISEMKTLNRKFATIAMQKTFIAFIKNMGSKRFALIALLSLAAGEALNRFLPGTPAPMVMFFVFSVPYFEGSFNPMFTQGPKKPEFSIGKYYHVLTVVITFISIWLVKFWDTESLRHIVLLSYALLTAVADAKYHTTSKLFEEYKTQYHAG